MTEAYRGLLSDISAHIQGASKPVISEREGEFKNEKLLHLFIHPGFAVFLDQFSACEAQGPPSQSRGQPCDFESSQQAKTQPRSDPQGSLEGKAGFACYTLAYRTYCHQRGNCWTHSWTAERQVVLLARFQTGESDRHKSGNVKFLQNQASQLPDNGTPSRKLKGKNIADGESLNSKSSKNWFMRLPDKQLQEGRVDEQALIVALELGEPGQPLSPAPRGLHRDGGTILLALELTMGTERVACRGGSRETGGPRGRKSRMIRLFVKLAALSPHTAQVPSPWGPRGGGDGRLSPSRGPQGPRARERKARLLPPAPRWSWYMGCSRGGQ
ncbi:hypothetical protein EYF80_014028 [Liparis tanakae]|uniref:Uncharacterized protein n=1 Tax=Liparis tanakae TaxID=230148 RepID=A0A4Z2IDN8_9TELE|nr:hypothetical protein EYF80_014028 [Liparis tanakae]